MWVVLRVIDVFKATPCVSVKSVHYDLKKAQQSAGTDDELVVVKVEAKCDKIKKSLDSKS
jgi:hypothetical protein